MLDWTRGERIAFWACLITIIAIIVSITTPEIRNIIGLTRKNTNIKIVQQSFKSSKIKINPSSSIKTKLTLKKGINIKIFNACNSKNAHIKLKNYLLESFLNNIKIDSEYNWKYRNEMEKTEIFYISNENKAIANSIEKFLRGNQIVVDYKTEGKKRGFFGLEKRDLVIFIGNDYERVFTTF